MRLSGLEPVPLAAGVDIGGSKVAAVALDGEQQVLAEVRLQTASGAHGVLGSAVDAVRLLADRAGVPPAEFTVVGVGVPGLVRPGSGDVSHAVNLGVGDGGLSLGASLSEQVGVPVVVENDVNAAALGAAHLLGRDDADLAYLSIGTGLAAGLVTGGRVRRGARGAAGEIGHVPVDPAGPLCGCGQRGCLETMASGSAIAAAWPVSDGVAPATALFGAAAAGDHLAIELRDRFADHVASAVRLLVLTCDVETVVVGGGVAGVGPALVDALVAALQRQAEGSAFLAALALPERVAVLPEGTAVAAVGAALAGVVAHASGETAPPDDLDRRPA